MNDTRVIDKILSRDRSALSLFYRTYTPKLERFIRTKIDNRQDAEEVLQDTLFAFLEAIRDFHGNASIQTFLYSICNHKIIDFYRRKKIRHVVFSHVPQLEAFVSPLIGPEDQLDMVLLKEKIQKVLAKLMPHYRTVLTLKYIDNMSVTEISQKLAISFKSAESQIFRARKAFIEAFLAI
jgi:RNA polymerase sigma-70 factor (ECF subfamily)